MTQPTVTQEDRDAAARLHGYANWAVWEFVPHHEAAWMQLCAKDFARHREAAEAATIAKVVSWLRTLDEASWTIEEVADAANAGEWKQ